MSLRKSLNGSPVIVIVVVVVIIIVAIYLGYRQIVPEAPVKATAYFTVDDGKTWFGGDSRAVSPIQHNGQTAYRAYVYRCADGKEFVGYMERFPDDVKALLDKALANPDSIAVADRPKVASASVSRQMKKPGGSKWEPLPVNGITIACPDGKTATMAR